MLVFVFQILLCFIFSSAILSFIKNTALKVILLIIFTLFGTLELNSIMLGGSLIDYKFIQHLNFETIWAAKSAFIVQTIKVIMFGLALFWSLRTISNHDEFIKINKYIRLGIVGVCFLGMSVSGGILFNVFEIVKLKSTIVSTDFDQSLALLHPELSNYVSSENIEIEDIETGNESVSKPKNIIVISMESFEKAYLSDNLSYLTPNLRKLKDNMTFFNMESGPGSDWTSGSVYTEMTGFPCFFKKQNNEIFQGVAGTRISGLGHILDKAGYDLTYGMAIADFAGNKEMLTANKFTVLSENEFSQDNPMGQWGTQDKDLFKEAKGIIKNKASQKKPFALFLSTISTHAPNGVYDKRMESCVKKQKTDLETMVAATDYHIGDLFEFLKNENLLNNTVVYIFPDHLLMGVSSETEVMKKFPEHRSLFFLTNAPAKLFSYPISQDIYQIDIPKLILEGAGIKHNVKFFTDLIEGDKIKYLHEHKTEILTVNETSLIYKKDELTANKSLPFGERLYSANRQYSLVVQKDGNVAAYEYLSKPVWSANTFSTPASILEMKEDGNLIIKDKQGHMYWESKTANNPDAKLVLGNDGFLRIMDKNGKPIWVSVNM